jgi:Fe2+ or Zn2+ uptake regulation protein
MSTLASMGHATAQEIYDHVADDTRISLGTVYRNLQILEQEGSVAAVVSETPSIHYDHSIVPHYHLHCRACGRIWDAPVHYHRELNDEAATGTFQVETHTVLFNGLCEDCSAAGG